MIYVLQMDTSPGGVGTTPQTLIRHGDKCTLSSRLFYPLYNASKSVYMCMTDKQDTISEGHN